MVIARGPGPGWFRAALAVVAALYFVMLLHHPEPRAGFKQIAFFAECTCLFPAADQYATEYRLDGWSCTDRAWEPLDPRVYFPIHAEDKESRFQRLAYFYQKSGRVLRSLAEFVIARHDERHDGIAGTIGGIRVSRIERVLPPPGAPVERYHYDPLGPTPLDGTRQELYATPGNKRAERCSR